MNRQKTACRTVLLSAALAAGTALGSPEAPYNPYGACAHITRGEPPARTCAMMRQAGMGWVRCDFDWHQVEAKKGEWNFERFDEIVAACEAEDVQLLPILGYSVKWAKPVHEHLDEWEEYVRRVVEHYGRRLPVLEVWNEQNIPEFWKSPNPTNYLSLLRRTYETVKKVDPSIRVAFGGTAGVPFEFFEEVYRLGGANCFDIVCVHPYSCPKRPEGVIDAQIEKLRLLMAQYGDADKPIWATEVGWPTHNEASSSAELLIAGLKAARPEAKTWRMIYVPARQDEDPDADENVRRELSDALPGGSSVEICRGIDLAGRLTKGDVDAVVYPFAESYASDSVDAVHAFVKAGGVLVDFGGMPMHGAYRTAEDGTMQSDGEAIPWHDRQRLRIDVTAWWMDKRYPKSIQVFPTDAADGLKVPPRGFPGKRFLTDRLLMPGDEFIPLLSAQTSGVEAVAAAVYRFGSDMKGAVVAGGVMWRGVHGASSEPHQARMTARALGIAFAEGVETCFVYEFRDPELDPCDKESYFGIVHGNFAPKPAYGTYMTFVGARPAGSVQKRAQWRSEDGRDYYPQWTRPDGSPAGMVWTTGPARRIKLAFTSQKMTFLHANGARLRPDRQGDVYTLSISGSPIYFIGGELKEIQWRYTQMSSTDIPARGSFDGGRPQVL